MVDTVFTRILYMEDDPGLARLLQKTLQRRGFEITIAPDGREGLAKATAEGFDLLLVDYNMPYYGGIEVIRTLRKQGELVPVIMVTGQGSEEIAVEAIKLGASDYIVKDAEMKYLELLPMVIDRVLYQQKIQLERKSMEATIRENEERYRRLVELSLDGIAIHAEGKFVFMNPMGMKILGAQTPDQVLGKPLLDIIHPEFHALAKERLEQIRGEKGMVPWIEEKFVRLDGAEINVEVAGISFTHEGKPAVQMMFRDITDRKAVEARLERLALYDTLTGLPNRTLFFDRMNQLLNLAKRNQYVLGLLFIDLDRFKNINDTLGHESGDSVLVEASKRMTSCTRSADTVARMGGDEFIGVCGRIAVAADAAVVAQKIIDSLGKPFHVKSAECSIGASVGISLYPQDGDDLETLLAKADAAMYRAKAGGKGGYRFFSDPEKD
jgi:diguanylate cyclase (GGDEF)-like protein/PAS domain S-box-containing protein